MEYDRVIKWLERKLQSESELAVAFGIGAMAGGIVILCLTWCAIHLVCLYSLSWILGQGHWACSLVPTVMIPLLFWGNDA